MTIFLCNDTATPECYTLSLHDALPICPPTRCARTPHLVRLLRQSRPPVAHGPLSAARGCSLLVSQRRRIGGRVDRSEEHTSELQSRGHLVCRLLLEKKNKYRNLCMVTS